MRVGPPFGLVLGVDFRSVLQLVEPRGGNYITGLNAFHRRVVALGRKLADGLNLRDLSGDAVHKRIHTVVLNCSTGDKDDAMERIHEQASVDELIWIQVESGVIELSSEANRSGCRVDLVVERQKFSGGDPGELCAVVRIYTKSLTMPNLIVELAQIVFRNIENDRDRLKLRDDGKSIRASGEDRVAGVYQPQAHSPRDRRSDVAVANWTWAYCT